MTNASAIITRRVRAAELDLLSLLEVAVARAPKVLKNGLPNLAFYRAANAALHEPDDESRGVGFVQVEFWMTLARHLGLTCNNDGQLGVTSEADRFFASTSEERLVRLREAWLDSTDLNEIALTPELELPSLRKGRTVDVTSDVPTADRMMDARRRLVEVVSNLEAETPLAGLIHRLEREQPNLFINHDDDKSWRHVHYRGIRERGGREDLERQGSWELVEGGIIRLICALPLSLLGWVEYDSTTESLTPVSDGGPDEPSFEVVVQPNFEVVALGDRPDPSALWKLARFSTPRPEGRVRTYVLERKPFADALGRGETAAVLVSFLESLSRSPIPQNVRFSLDDWATLSERIKIWPDALLIESEGVEDLTTALPERLLQTLDPTKLTGGHYACPAPNGALLKETLPPRRSVLDYSRRLPPVITPTEGTALLAPREELHLRARQLLSMISRTQSADRYELNAELVTMTAQALGAGELLRRLRDGLAKPLSSALSLAVRTWAGEFPRPFAGGAEVFLADNREQAELLDEMPAFRRWVDRRLAPGVFLLRPGGAVELRKVLDELGIQLRSDARGR